MGTYQQWRTAIDRDGPKRVTWVCGTQTVLAEEVVDTTRGALAPSDVDYVSLTAGSVPDKEIWAAANQYPLVHGANRLVLVRDAQKIKRWAPLEEWFARSRQLPTVFLVFVTSDERLRYGEPDEAGRRTLLAPALWIKNRGSLVECNTPNEADLTAWVQRQAPLADHVAQYLLARVGGNLATARNLVRKLAVFDGGQPSEEVINVLCAEMPSDSFVESLLHMKKTDALAAIDALPDKEYGKVVGLLDARLELLGTLNKAVRARAGMREISQLPGVPVFLARQFIGVAKDYDQQRVAYRRRVLAVIDEALGLGAREGTLEALVALW